MDPIPFNRPHVGGRELHYLAEVVTRAQLSGDGDYTRRCAELLEKRLGVAKVLLVPSCTAALELAAMLLELGPGDEVIAPSYTFVSTVNAFVRLGARPVFVDVRPDTLNLDERLIEAAITPRTKAIFPVHYAGVACEMDAILDIARRHKLAVVEDAAQGVNSWYRGRALGTLGQLGTYSFHDTKNYVCGEGGALCINDPALVERAEIFRDKGTNRRQFFRGQVDKYTWVDVGSSYVPSELCSAFLLGQLERLDEILARRQEIFDAYRQAFEPFAARGSVQIPYLPPDCRGNAHLFYLLLPSQSLRDGLIAYLKEQSVMAVFHYIPLHTAPMGRKLGCADVDLPITSDFSARLVRLPLFCDLTAEELAHIIQHVSRFLTIHCQGQTVPRRPARAAATR